MSDPTTTTEEDGGRPVWTAIVAGLMLGLHAALAAAVLGVLVTVVPSFAMMFAEVGAELPVPTQLVILVSDFVLGSPLVVGGLGCVLALLDAALIGDLWWKDLRKGLIGLAVVSAGTVVLTPLLFLVGLYLPIFQITRAVGGP